MYIYMYIYIYTIYIYIYCGPHSNKDIYTLIYIYIYIHSVDHERIWFVKTWLRERTIKAEMAISALDGLQKGNMIISGFRYPPFLD